MKGNIFIILRKYYLILFLKLAKIFAFLKLFINNYDFF